MKSKEIRKKFFDFFIKHNHTKVASSSLVPAEDPTILFTNAGMNQFKDLFLGKEKRNYTKAVSIQKCMRAGGKHNDLDNVGFTNRHLTLFEMMGNFSFGDYFKKEAIQFAWDFLTKEMKFDPENMYATVYKSDDESYDLWHSVIGLPKERISRLGEADNFWQMGDTGPCGPCTEIMIDRGIEFGCGSKNCAPGCECDRYLEVWNLVFMQYNRRPDGSDIPLDQTGVDTGMGLERLALIMQQKNSVFETDLFATTIQKTEELTGHIYEKSSDEIKAAFNVIADHVRSASFLIADGITPSNDGRGYVLRKIIRRAALFAQKITDQNIFGDLAITVIEEMSPIYPELKQKESAIKKLIAVEVKKFAFNLVTGQNMLNQYFAYQKKEKRITGEQAFKLYDTYGFPVELIRIISHDHGFTVDTDGFERNMQKQKEQSSSQRFKIEAPKITLPETIKTEFVGYHELVTKTKISALIVDNALVETVNPGQPCWIVPAACPFYVEKGGQVSDQGVIEFGKMSIPIGDLKRIGEAIAISITAPIDISINDNIIEKVDVDFRKNVMYNHTATHLLQAALISILGDSVRQSGSLVHPDYLRFDFTYHESLTNKQITEAEILVNEKIRDNIPVNIFETDYDDAIKRGVIAIFGEKYNPEKVRVIDIPNFSAELCGGTHVPSTGVIGAFKITQEGTLSAGQRRIFAVTGPKAIELFQNSFNTTKKLCQQYKAQPENIINTIDKQQGDLKEAQSKIKKLKKELWKYNIPALLQNIEKINGIPFLVHSCENQTMNDLRDIGQMLTEKLPGCYFLYTDNYEKNSFFFIASPEYEKNIDTKSFAQWLKTEFSFQGGGKKGILQGGGPRQNFKKVKTKIIEWFKK